MALTKTESIDIVNIGLILLSLIIAINLPFQLFLFSYIILGPLHYMTEIGWLSQRNFFIRENVPKWPLFTLGVVCSLIFIYMGAIAFLAKNGHATTLSGTLDNQLDNVITSIIFIAFLSTFTFLITKNKVMRILMILGLIAMSIFLYNVPWFLVVFGVMIPTLIHTTIFTGAFMLQGALKSKSLISYTAFAAFVMAYILIFYLPIDPTAGHISKWIQDIFLAGDFFVLNYNLFNIFYDTSGSQLVLDSGVGLKIQAFIAFAYTYHYLNWFSKTEIIRWHTIPKKWLVATVLVWIASVSIHLIDIKLGITAIGLISLMHVFLEFPLNNESFISIGKQILGKE